MKEENEKERIEKKYKKINGRKASYEDAKALEKKHSWLALADFEEAEIEESNNKIVWKSGIWRNGKFLGEKWLDGLWKNGVWCGGVWYCGEWRNGDWLSGVWKSGVWYIGYFAGGTWEKGIMWHNLKQTFVSVKYNNEKKEFEEIEETEETKE